MTTEPPTPNKESKEDATPVLTLITQIKKNKLDPVVLSAEERRRCVDVLWAEGYTVPQIAQILQRSERTIHRDRTVVRAAHKLHVSPGFALQMAGELMRQAEISVSRLRQIAREPGASAMERGMAEQFAFKAYCEMISKLQSMGYLPRIPTGVVAQVVGASSDETIPTYDQLAKRLKEIDSVDKELGPIDPKIAKKTMILKELVQQGRTAAEVAKLHEEMKEKEGDN